MAKFEKGQSGNPPTRISGDIAEEYQRRSAAKRKENKTIAEMLRVALQEDAGNGMTKGEFLIRKAIQNHKDGRLGFKDLKDLSRILGEDTINIKTDGTPIQVVVGTSEAADGLRMALQTGARPAKPADE